MHSRPGVLLQFNPDFITDMLAWVPSNGLEAHDVRPNLVGGARARVCPDTRDKTMTRPPTTDTELERVRSLAFSDNPLSIDIWMDISNTALIPAGVYPKSMTHSGATLRRMLETDSVYHKFINWVVKVSVLGT